MQYQSLSIFSVSNLIFTNQHRNSFSIIIIIAATITPTPMSLFLLLLYPTPVLKPTPSLTVTKYLIFDKSQFLSTHSQRNSITSIFHIQLLSECGVTAQYIFLGYFPLVYLKIA